MKIAINAHLLGWPSLRGWNRYTVNVAAALGQLGADVRLFSDLPLHESHRANLPGDMPIVVAPPMRYTIWEQSWLAKQCAIDRIDILHSPYNYGLPWRCSAARVLTLHDVLSSVSSSSESISQQLSAGAVMSRLRHRIARRVADRIITVSNFSKQDIVRRLGVVAERIDVVYGAADQRFAARIDEATRADVRHRYRLDRPYILYIGGWEERKNLPFLVRAFAAAKLIGHELVLAGGGVDEQRVMKQLCESLGLENQVRLLGVAGDADLPALYAAAVCFVYPSTYEGFGLQLCEAMAAGCPLLAADATSLPEVLGDGGERFSLGDPAELVNLLREVANDPIRREDLRQRGHARAKQFSWDRTARQTMEIYKWAMASHQQSRA